MEEAESLWASVFGKNPIEASFSDTAVSRTMTTRVPKKERRLTPIMLCRMAVRKCYLSPHGACAAATSLRFLHRNECVPVRVQAQFGKLGTWL
jgi:hypothetical protein